MTIEQNLADLTLAINNLTAVLTMKVLDANATTIALKMPEQSVSKEETSSPKSETAAASSAPPADTPATPEKTAAPAGDKPIDFTSQIQKPIVAMAAGGRRAEALAILKELGASKASEIKPEDYARAVELIAKAG